MTACKDDEQIMTPDDTAELFCQMAHGNAEHRLWLKNKLEHFFCWQVPNTPEVLEALKEPEGRNVL